MGSQKLIHILEGVAPASGTTNFPHTLRAAGRGMAPTFTMFDGAPNLSVVGADSVHVAIRNTTGAPQAFRLFCRADSSFEATPTEGEPRSFFAPSAGAHTPVSLPPTGPAGGALSGTYPNPSLAALSPSPAGTYGSSTSVPVFTVDARGRVTSSSMAAIPSGGAAGTPALRALGIDSQQACAGDDVRLRCTLSLNVFLPATAGDFSANRTVFSQPVGGPYQLQFLSNKLNILYMQAPFGRISNAGATAQSVEIALVRETAPSGGITAKTVIIPPHSTVMMPDIFVPLTSTPIVAADIHVRLVCSVQSADITYSWLANDFLIRVIN